MVDEPKQLTAIGGIGKGMAANIVDLVRTGSMPLRDELLQKYRPVHAGPAAAAQHGSENGGSAVERPEISNMDQLEAAAKAGHLSTLPRFGQKQIDKILKGIEDHQPQEHRPLSHRCCAEDFAERITALIRQFPGIDTITPAGSSAARPRER